MSSTAHVVINAIPGVEELRYLELGICGGGTFDRVRAKTKVGVDISCYPNAQPPTYLMSTDNFFAGPGSLLKFDVVFIDACHDLDFVLRDYNNAIRVLDKNGIILLHDLIPPDEKHTHPSYCSDSFRLLLAMIDQKIEVVVQDGDYGLTAVRNAQILKGCAHSTYNDLLDVISMKIRLVPLQEMIDMVISWRRS